MTRLSWDLVGGDPAPGEPSAYAELARDLGQTAENAAGAHRRLNRFGEGCDEGIWRGEAADAFREKIKELPPKLAKLQRSYDTAARAMAEYGRALADLQPRARTLLGQAEAAVGDKAAEERSRDEALAVAPDPGLLGVFSGSPSTPFDQAIDVAESRLREVRNGADDLRDERRSAENRAVDGLERAHEEGIKNDSWLEKRLEDIDRFVDKHADFLKKISGVLKIVSAVAGLLSFIPFLAPICGPIALIAGGAALLIDATLCATGNGSWKALAVDAALMALPGAGKLLGGGAKMVKVRGLRAARPPGGFTSATMRGRAVQFGKRLKRGDPIDVATGDMVMSEIDVDLPGLLPLVLERTYVSSYREGRWFGPSWASTLDQRLEVDEFGVCYVAADGMVLVYPTPSVGSPVLPVEGPRWPLARRDDGGYALEVDDEKVLHFAPVSLSQLRPLTAVTDRNGHRLDLDLDYDGDGMITGVRHSGGYHVGIETTGGLVTALRLVGAAGGGDVELVRYGYDDARHLTEVFNSSGLPMRFTYDSAGRITSWEDRVGAWYRYTYDDDGRCVRTEGVDGCLDATYEYDPDERSTVWTNSLGHATTFHFNELLQVVRQTDALGHSTLSEWDRYDRLLIRTDPLGRTTRYRYDTAGNLVALTRPDGHRITAEYNERRQPVLITEPDGSVRRQEYDDKGNLTAAIDPAGASTTYRYGQHGQITAIVDALGQERRIASDETGRPVAVTDPLGATTRYTRDPFGRAAAITDPLGGVIRLRWTVEGRLAERTLPDGATDRWVYDGEGNIVEHVDVLGRATRTEVGSFDLPAARTNPDGSRLEFSYDTELRLVSVTNPQGFDWRYEYDHAGNLRRETDFNGRELRYEHDPAGQLTGRTNGAGQTTSFVRDTIGNVDEQRSGDAVSTFDYDLAGRMVRATNADADLTFERDRVGRVVTETCNEVSLTSSFDVLGRRISRRTPSGSQSAWEYDANDHPTALRTGGQTLRFRYDGAGREVERLIGPTSLGQVWDANHRLQSQTLTTGRTAQVLQHRSYSYRADGHVIGIEDLLSGSRYFDLDALGQVTAVSGAGWTERYAYDTAGNITSAEWPDAPDTAPGDDEARGRREYSANLITQAGRVRYEHDAQGRVVLRQQKRLSGKPLTWRYTWDSDDRLVAVTTPKRHHWRYRYDALGRRIAKQRLAADQDAVAEEVTFTWDGTVLAEQMQVGDGRSTAWEWEPGTHRAVSQAERAPLPDVPQEWVDERFYAIVTDLVGTPTELVAADGQIASTPRTALWGQGRSDALGHAPTPLRFPGQYHDPETALSYNYLRHYDPDVGRYGSSDPLGLVASPNPHAYVLNPVTQLDPLGLAPAGCGAASDTAGSIRRVNPLGGTQNCVNCAIATDATLAGRPAVALMSGPQPISVLERTFGGSFKPVSGADEIRQLLSSAGPGARGIVFGSRGVGVGHVFNAVNQRGVVRFLDGQIGGPASFEGFDAFHFLRTDL